VIAGNYGIPCDLPVLELITNNGVMNHETAVPSALADFAVSDSTVGVPGPRVLCTADIERICAEHYGLAEATVIPLGGELARNARIDTPAGSFMFKAQSASAGVEADALERRLRWQDNLIGHLLDDASGIPVPTPARTLNGDTLLLLIQEEHVLCVQVSAWMPGVLLGAATGPTVGALRELGRFCGRIHRAVGGLPRPYGANDHDWSIETMPEVISRALASVTDPVRRRSVNMLTEHFARCRHTLAGLPQAITHHDLNDYNVLVDPTDGPMLITGIIDFDDARYSARVADLAIAAGYAMLGQDDPIAALAAVTDGYREEVTLVPGELEVVFPAAAARLCLNATIWTSRSGGIDGSYGNARMSRTWPIIEYLATLDPDDVLLRLAEGSSARSYPDHMSIQNEPAG
jgi:Ser/Thr protein kinase RdoA (MazF antagonist)